MSEEQEVQAPEGTLTDEMRTLIERHLPAETVGVLRKRLERLSSVEGELRALETRFGTTDAELTRTRSELHHYKQRQGDLERRE